MSELADAAVAYTRLGLGVLPLTPGAKAPLGKLVPHGVRDASTDEAIVREWWRAAPEANIGVRTGGRLAVLDVDPRNGGAETLDRLLEAQGGRLPSTPEVCTGGDGWHHYFDSRSSIRSRKVGAGLDLKADGGYVVSPPSMHPSGRLYAWHPSRGLGDVRLAPLPDWLGPAALPRGPRPPHEWAGLVRSGVAEGARNTTTAKLAGHLLARGVDPAVVLVLLVAWDQQRNRPSLGEVEVERVVASIAAREARKLRGKA